MYFVIESETDRQHGDGHAERAIDESAGPHRRPRYWLVALRGAIGFLTRLPLSQRDGEWQAFTRTPATFPIVGMLVGGLVAIPLLVGTVSHPATVALGYVLAVYLVTGVNHMDGVADLGDAVVVHGDRQRRRTVMKDTTTGVGALLAVVFVITGLALGGFALASLSLAGAIAVVIAAEVGAKVGMAALACFGRPAHEGLGSALIDATDSRAFVAVIVLSLPVVLLSWPTPTAALTLLFGILGACLPWWWAQRELGGVTGDVFGAANEIGRVLGVHAGVIAWMLW